MLVAGLSKPDRAMGRHMDNNMLLIKDTVVLLLDSKVTAVLHQGTKATDKLLPTGSLNMARLHLLTLKPGRLTDKVVEAPRDTTTAALLIHKVSTLEIKSVIYIRSRVATDKPHRPIHQPVRHLDIMVRARLQTPTRALELQPLLLVGLA